MMLNRGETLESYFLWIYKNLKLMAYVRMYFSATPDLALYKPNTQQQWENLKTANVVKTVNDRPIALCMCLNQIKREKL